MSASTPGFTPGSTTSQATEGGHGGTTASGGDTPQRMRIFVPTGDAELVLGLNDDRHLGIRARTTSTVDRKARSSVVGTIQEHETVEARTRIGLGVNEKGFVGVLATADHGNVLLCATGAADIGSDYNHASRVGVIIETAVNVARTGLLLWSTRYHAAHTASIPQTVGFGQVLWSSFNAITSPFSGDVSGGLGNMDYLKTGHVTLFGARSVKMESIEGVSSTAALFNSHSAGLSASLNSVLLASVNSGCLASVNGAFSASLNGQTSTVIGVGDAGLSSRVGAARVEGKTVRIGSRRQAGMKARHLSGIQEETQDVWMRARDFVEVAVTHPREKPNLDPGADGHLIGMLKHPVGLQIVPTAVRLNTDFASLRMGSGVRTMVSKTVMNVTARGIELGRLKVNPSEVAGPMYDTARAAYNTAWGLSEGVVKQLGAAFSLSGVSKTKLAMGALGALAASGVGAALGATAAGAKGEGGAEEGAKVGAAVGAAVGGVGVMAAMMLTAMKTAGLAQRAGQQAARQAYTKALTAIQLGESAAATVDPTAPKIQVTDSHVLISFGVGSSVKISAAGVDIKGMKVTVNDMTLGPPMVPPIPAVPLVADPEPPEIRIGAPPVDSPLSALA